MGMGGTLLGAEAGAVQETELFCRGEQRVDPVMHRHAASCKRSAESKPEVNQK